MAYQDPNEAFTKLKASTLEAVRSHFPVRGKQNTLELLEARIDDDKNIMDIHSQRDAKEKGRSWTVPIKAKVALKDSTGKVIDTQEITVGALPKMTGRHSYIVDGNEYQVNNQFRLKSGVYTMIKANGVLNQQWNLEKGLGFNMNFEPQTRKMTLKIGDSNVPLYPVMKALGVDDDTLQKTWGKEILNANMVGRGKDSESYLTGTMHKVYKALHGRAAVSDAEATKGVVDSFSQTALRPDSTQVTLGKPYKTVDGAALLSGSENILRVSKGEREPDNRDSLVFKDLYSAEDLLAERIGRDKRRDISQKIVSRVDKVSKVKEVLSPETFGLQINKFFTSGLEGLVERPTQTNPVQFRVGARRTTISGVHGISGSHNVPEGSRTIDPSAVGFLDAVHTPENSKIGTILQLGTAAKKDGKDLKTRVFNTKTGKTEYITPLQALNSTLGFGDQYKWENGKPTPLSQSIKVTDKSGDYSIAKPSEVDYIIRSPKGMFDVSTNLIPFLQNNQGNRTSVAARQLEQAISLVNREAPLVQVKGEGSHTLEQALGRSNAHVSDVDGTVYRVTKDAIHIKSAEGSRKIPLYDDFPLNDERASLTSTPLVKAGDKVVKGQVVGDSNYTRKGDLALGSNLRVAYMPYLGLNFEDGIVISESAAKKLKSEHMIRESVTTNENTILDKNRFFAEVPGQYSKDQAEKLDEQGVVLPGTVLKKGDVIIGSLQKEQWRPEKALLAKFSKTLLKPVRPNPQIWDKDHDGHVVRVAKHGKDVTVLIKAQSEASIGDKIVARHGNKGVIVGVLPDAEMPHTKDGEHMEILLNPSGLPTRINLGQVLETAASKIARKTGKPYVVNNFDSNVPDYTRKILGELAAHGLSDTEHLYDPKTGRKVHAEPVLTGEQYILKLHHTVDKKLSARSRGSYDVNEQPKKGPTGKAQSMDVYGLYALLAHGARENIREMQTVKGGNNDDYWHALQSGESLPPPKVPFAYEKFLGYLKGMGVNVEKDGSRVQLSPLTDAQVLSMSNGEMTKAGRALRAKDLRPEKGSIFDETITGTKVSGNVFQMGTKWGHFTLSEAMPNPVFEKPIRTVLGLDGKTYDSVLQGKEQLDGLTGPEAIAAALRKIDVKGELEKTRAKIPGARQSHLNALVQKTKYLKALDQAGLDAKDAYTMKHVPVLPPYMRPITVLPDGGLSTDGLNDLYRGIAHTNEKLADPDLNLIPEDIEGGRHQLTKELYDGLKALTLVGLTPYARSKHKSGIAEVIAGVGSPKFGYFQKKLIGKRQDLSMRGVIVPEPSLGVDEVGIPEIAAKEIYKPFVQRRLVRLGRTPREAAEEMKANSPAAHSALETEMQERPLLLKRDPVLHKYGVQAYRPRMVSGSAIRVHPLSTSGFNSDFDGDAMSAYVPISQSAVQEAVNMLPSRNIFSPSTGKLMLQPSQESMMGLYDLTRFGRQTTHRFKNVEDAARAVAADKIRYTDVVTIDDPSLHKAQLSADLLKTAAAPVRTTIGRLMVASALPETMRTKEVLTDEKYELNKGNLGRLLTDVARNSSSADFSASVDKMKDMGYRHATGFSFSLKDLQADTEVRDKVLGEAREKEKEIRKRGLSKNQRDQKIVELYGKAGDVILGAAKSKADKSTNRLYDWVKSGARGSWEQFHQMTVSPLQVVDSRGNTVPVPIDKSYSEGLDSASYYAAMYGARMGTIGRVKGTQDPGTLTKQLMQTSMNQVVTSEDCGTNNGIHVKVDDSTALDRFLAKDISLGSRGGHDKGVIPKGTLITPDVISRLKNNKVDGLVVRSPLKCEEPQGMCAHCFGLNQDGKTLHKGVNIGVIATHALGEPMTQMAMNCNAAGNIITIRELDSDPDTCTLEQLWMKVRGPTEEADGVETRTLKGYEVWDHDRYTPIHTIQRHMPSAPMLFVKLEDGRAFIVQSDHPNWAREEAPACVTGPSIDEAGLEKSPLQTREVIVEAKDLTGWFVGVSQPPAFEWDDDRSLLWFQSTERLRTSVWPQGWLNLSRAYKHRLISELFFVDGRTAPDGSIRTTTAYWPLVAQVQILVRSLGGRVDVDLRRGDHPLFELSIELPSATDTPVEPVSSTYVRVSSVQKVRYADWTYDLSTETQGFSTCGIRTHNSFHCNHAKSIVFCKDPEGRIFAPTMERLFVMMPSRSKRIGADDEYNDGYEGWQVYDGEWVDLEAVHRHAPDQPMVMLSAGSFVTVCQDNHPLWTREGNVRCAECGHHRLKRQKHCIDPLRCMECGLRQQPMPENQNEYRWLPPSRLAAKRDELHQSSSPLYEATAEPTELMPPYLMGLYFSCGHVLSASDCTGGRREKVPTAVVFATDDPAVSLAIPDGWSKHEYPKEIIIRNARLADLITHELGTDARTVALPPDFIGYPDSWLGSFLCGLIDGNAFIAKSWVGDPRLAFKVKNFALLQQVLLICRKLKLTATVGTSALRAHTKRQVYEVRLRYTPRARVALSGSYKASRLEKVRSELNIQDGPVEIHNIRHIAYDETHVYDLKTSSKSLYVGGLRSHNSGGVAKSVGSKARTEFARAAELVKFPDILPDSAILSTASGKVEKITLDKVTGGHKVLVGGMEHFIPALKGMPIVKAGETVKKGDSLSSGSKNPRELLPLTDLPTVQRYVTDELSKLYRGGSTLHRRNTEVMVRALTNSARVTDPGDHKDLFPGDVLPVTQLSALNKALHAGQKPIEYKPILKSAAILPIEVQTDWMARMQASELKQTLTDAVAEGWSSELHGLHPVPGMAYAKDFGHPPAGEEPWKY